MREWWYDCPHRRAFLFWFLRTTDLLRLSVCLYQVLNSQSKRWLTTHSVAYKFENISRDLRFPYKNIIFQDMLVS